MNRLFALILLGLVSGVAPAQTALTLEDAVLRGLENNFQIRIARTSQEIAAGNNTLEASGIFPNVVVNGSNGNTVTDNSQNPTAFIQDRLTANSFEGAVALDWTLFNGFSVWITRDKLQLLEDQSAGNTALVVENTVQAIILAYWNAVLQETLLELQEEVTGLSSDRLTYTNANRDLGTASTFDVVQARTALLSDTTALLQQQLAVVDATRNLNLLMGEDSEATYMFDSPMTAPEAIPALEELTSKLQSGNRQLQLQYLDLQLMDQDLKLARGSRYPALGFQSGWSNSQSAFAVGELSGNGTTTNYYANFTLSFNLYGGGAIRRQIQQLELSREISELTAEDLKRSLMSELNSGYDRYRMQADLVGISKANVDDALVNLQLSEDRFNRGQINSFNFRDAQVAYRNAQYTHYLQLYQLLTAEAGLRKLTGELVGG